MPIVRYSAEEARRRGRARRKVMKAASETLIARDAAADRTDTSSEDIVAGVRAGRWRVLQPLDVAAIRAKTGLSQARFARAFQISPHTLRNWEQRRRVPEGPARALLLAIDRDPKTLMRALQD